MKRTLLLLILLLAFKISVVGQLSLNLPSDPLSFNGIDQYVAIPNNPALEFTTGTIEMWIKPDWNPLTKGEPPCFISERDDNGSRFSLHISADYRSVGIWNNMYSVYTSFTFTRGEWYHIAAVMKVNSTQFYINGNPIGIIPHGINASLSGYELKIGSSAMNKPEEFFQGEIDEVRVWNTARTITEIQTNMFDPIEPSAPNLIAYYKIDEGVTSKSNAQAKLLKDYSNNSLNGTMKNYWSSNANLSNLAINQGIITPAFAPATAAYIASVKNSVTSLAVTPAVADAKASVTVNGNPVTSGNSSSISLSIGSNIIPVVVTAEDGTTKTYQITVDRNAAPSDILLSSSQITENSQPKSLIGFLTAVDANSHDSFTYSLANGEGDTDNSTFFLSGNEIRIMLSPDYESKRSYTIRVKATDSKGDSFEKAFTVTVDDVNENPQFTSTPVTAAAVGTDYTYAISGTDPFNNKLAISAAILPSWLILGSGSNTSTAIGGEVIQPGGIAGDDNGNIYVTELHGKNIYKISPDGVKSLFYTRDPGYVYAMMVHDGFLYLSRHTESKITRIDLNDPYSLKEQLVLNVSVPLSMTMHNGFMYVVSYQGSVVKVDLNNNTSTSYVSGLSGPFGLGFDSNNILYIAEYNAGRLSKYDGVTLSLGVKTGIRAASDVKIDNNGYVYVSSSQLGIQKYVPDLSSFTPIETGQSIWGMYLLSSGTLVYGINNQNKVAKLETGAVLSGKPLIGDIGTHPVTLTASNGTQSVDQSFTISVSGPATLDNFANLTKNYGDDSFELTTPTSTSDGTFTYSSSNAGVATIDGNKVTIVRPGTTTITAQQAASGLYTGASITATLTVAPKDITVSLNAMPLISKVYNGNNDAVLDPANYLINGKVGSDEITVSGTATFDNKQAGENKAVTASNLVLSGANNEYYNLVTTSATTLGSITPKSITAFAEAVVKTYDGTAGAAVRFKGFTEANGLVGSDELSAAYNTASYDDKHVGTGKQVSVNGLRLEGADKHNYSLANFSTTGSILPKEITVSALSLNKTYGENDPAFTYQITSGSLAAGDNFTGTLSRDAGENVGAYAIKQGSLVLSNDYSLSYTENNLVIGKKELIIKADDNEKFVGTSNPEFTVSFDGFVNGEDENVLTAKPVASTAATAESPLGTYPITVSGASSPNYEIGYQEGVLTVKPGAPTNIVLTAATIFENSAKGTIAGQLSSTSDDPNASFTYSLASGSGDSDNKLFVISGDRILTDASLNFEHKANYKVRVKSTTQHGFGLEKEFTISISNVNEAPTLSTISDQTICYSTSEQKIAMAGISAGEDNGQTVALSIVSSNDDLFSKLEVAGKEVRYRVKNGASGTAVVTVTVTDDGGIEHGGVDSYSRTFTLTVNPLPVVTIVSDKGAELSKGLEANLTASGGVAYKWANAHGIVHGQNSATLTIRPSETTTYRVVVTNEFGCAVEKEFTIQVSDNYMVLEANNIMSPNGDGINDRFKIENIDMYPKNEVKIYDRAGRLLYSQKNYTDEWDGTFNGSPLAEDTYFYIVDFGPGVAPRKGFITIVRE